MIAIVDYGMGNLRSVQKAVSRLGYECIITADPELLDKTDKIILPGVGHFQKGMENIEKSGLLSILNKIALIDKKPILGICLGMQLMTNYSEEGDCNGLGWINAKTIRFKLEDRKIPHIGWNTLEIINQSYLSDNILINDEFYFVHSYYVKCQDQKDVAFRTDYGIQFDSGFKKENISGVQFHPEKSHEFGLKIMQNFLRFDDV